MVISAAKSLLLYLRKIVWCGWFGRHSYFVIKHYAPYIRKVGCSVCGRAWGMHDDIRTLVPWDSYLEYWHERLFVEE